MQWCVFASSQYKLHVQSRPLSCSLEVIARASRSAVRCRLTAQGFACISHDCVKCRVSNVNHLHPSMGLAHRAAVCRLRQPQICAALPVSCTGQHGSEASQAVCTQIMRNKQKVHEGKVTSLRRVKDDVKEVPAGLECGLAVETYLGWREGDRIELCEIKSKQQTLEEASPVPAPAAVPVGV